MTYLFQNGMALLNDSMKQKVCQVLDPFKEPLVPSVTFITTALSGSLLTTTLSGCFTTNCLILGSWCHVWCHGSGLEPWCTPLSNLSYVISGRQREEARLLPVWEK